MELRILKRNFQILKNDFNVYTDKFLIETKNGGGIGYDISQNFNSFPLLWSSLFYPTPASCFFLELVNFFGNLKIDTTIPYSSFSQSLTTYCLKMLARKNIIKIQKLEWIGHNDLDDYEI